MSSSRMISANGIEIFVTEQGSGPLVLLCHGWPELSHSWRHQLPALAAAGYHVVAPDMRGYGRTSAPQDISAYSIFDLVGDMVGLVTALGETKAVIIGHDWGALAVYAALALAPHKLSAAVTLAVPHIHAAMRNALRAPIQLWRSRYMLRFQLPGAARWLRCRDFAYVDALWRRWSPALTPPAAHLAAVKTSLAASGAAPLAHYREMVRGLSSGIARPPVSTTPLLYLAGTADGCVGWELGRGQERWLGGGGYAERIYPGAGHFLHLERPREVAADIRAWLQNHNAAAGR